MRPDPITWLRMVEEDGETMMKLQLWSVCGTEFVCVGPRVVNASVGMTSCVIYHRSKKNLGFGVRRIEVFFLIAGRGEL